MKISKTRICKVCGKTYQYCFHCDADKKKPAWLTDVHDENCLTIFYALSDFFVGEKTQDECKKVLKNCDLSNLKEFPEDVKIQLIGVLGEDGGHVEEKKDIDKKVEEKKIVKPYESKKNNPVEK